MAANKFVLKGSGVEVDYTIGANPAIPALIYTAGTFQKLHPQPNPVRRHRSWRNGVCASDPQHRHRR